MENNQIQNLLKALGVNPDLLGSKCISELIHFSQTMGDEVPISLFYPDLIMKYGKSYFQIERAIRFVLYQMRKKRTSLYEQLFEDEPKISDFIDVAKEVVENKSTVLDENKMMNYMIM